MGLAQHRLTMARHALLASVVLLGSLAAACGKVTPNDDGGVAGAPGGGGSGGTGGRPAPTAEEACAHFSEIFCDALDTCATFFVQVWYGDDSTCRARTKLSCMSDQSLSGINRTPQNIVTCADAAKTATCDDLLAGNLPAACDPVPGPTVNGRGCGSSLQCMSGHCEKGSESCGTCAPRQPANGNCTVDEGCIKGLVCANQKCVFPRDLGNDCDPNNPCRSTLYCDKSTRKCAMPVGAGAACGSDGNACDLLQGVACSVTGNPQTCQTVGVAKAGQPCGIVSGTPTLCVELNLCSGVCPAPAADGTTCTDAIHCVPPATCVSGLCRLPSVANCPG
jgi:hypothetical protein